MLWICVMVYLAGWVVATAGVFVAGNRISEPGLPVSYRFALSAMAAFIWPLLLIGAIEFTSMAMYSRYSRDSSADDFPDDGRQSHLFAPGAEQTNGDVVYLR